jgi:hypothetical protein
MKIKEVINAVDEKITDHCMKYGNEPKLNIYMDYQYWDECMSDIVGDVPSIEYEFFYNQTIFGHVVYLVHANHVGKLHTPFLVCAV